MELKFQKPNINVNAFADQNLYNYTNNNQSFQSPVNMQLNPNFFPLIENKLYKQLNLDKKNSQSEINNNL